MGFTYAKSGVSVDKVKGIQVQTAKALASTLHSNVLLPAGHYSGLVEVGGQKIALHTDGVGTKVLVAQVAQKYDTVGIDCVAMNVNDLACIGAKPVALVDYIALEKADPVLIAEIMKGLVKGSKLADVSIIGGETAITPDLIRGEDGKGFDLSATCMGVVEGPLVTGENIQEGDIVIGLASSGLHSNGYSLARKVLLPPGKKPDAVILKELLEPTVIYSPAVMEIVEKTAVHGLAHITGGAFSKLTRILPKNKGTVLDAMPKPARIFQKLAKEGNISTREMYRTFNMGVGFCVILPKNYLDTVIAICQKHGIAAWPIGYVSGQAGVWLKQGSEKIDLT